MRALLLLLLLAAPATAGVRAPPPAGSLLGLVLATEGKVERAGQGLAAGAMLAEGEKLELAGGARLVFSLITTCKELTVEGPGALRFEAGAAVVDKARIVASAAAPGCVKADHVALSGASQARAGAVVVRGAGGTEGRLSPRGGYVTPRDRTLRWDGPLADGRKVLVTVARGERPGEVLVEEERVGGSFVLPEHVGLVPGGDYAWSVEPAGLNPGPGLAGSFRVTSDAVASQLASLVELATDGPGWLRVAFFCEANLLEVDAARAYAEALAKDPSAAGARARLVELDLP